MTVKTQQIVVCDKCGKNRTYEDNSYIRIDFSYRSTGYENLHFCSFLCAIRWLNETCQNELANEINTNLNEKINSELKRIVKEENKILEVN